MYIFKKTADTLNARYKVGDVGKLYANLLKLI